jgi:predicted PurR-regulated permease PerM
VSTIEDRTFLWLLLAVSVVFAWILWPLAGALLWAIIVAILFAPVQRRLVQSMRQRRNLAALTTLAVIVVIVILPVTLITASLLEEASGVFRKIQSGDLNLGLYFQRIFEAAPAWATRLLDRFGLTDLAAVQERLSGTLVRASQFLAARAVDIGQNTFDFIVSLFVMLYLLFFLLRDGDGIVARIRDAMPLRGEMQRDLAAKFTTVVRATIKGGVVVALVQGALGGLIFGMLGIHAAVLWGVLMTFLSLLPAVGAGLVWVPVAIWLLATGAVWQGIVLIAFGVLVIGLVDNLARPILVGKDTRLPDYLILISTVGGLAIFGINGFVIGPLIAAMFVAVWGIVASRSQAGAC